MYIKEWFYNKESLKARKYNIFFDTEARDEFGRMLIVNGYVSVVVEEFIKETEKAIQVKLGSGSVVGSAHGWTTWIPKSLAMSDDEMCEMLKQEEISA